MPAQSKPRRVQLSRVKGWTMPDNTVRVDRSTKWGNPFVVGKDVPAELIPYLVHPLDANADSLRRTLESLDSVRVIGNHRAVEAYSWWIIEQPHLMLSLDELEGRNLACWCKSSEVWCHADVLLELANGSEAGRITADRAVA